MEASKSRGSVARHVKYMVSLAALWICYVVSGIGCPVQRLLKIRCPACGVTRALNGLVTGDWELYCQMNPFAVPLVIAVLVGFHLPAMSAGSAKIGMLYVVTVACLNFCWYIGNFI